MELPGFVATLLPEEALQKLLKKQALSPYEWEGIPLVRLAHDAGRALPRGTVLAPDGLIPAYPRIRRVLHLQEGIKRHFSQGPFWVEEKMDGYNVRVALVKGRALAFTRGGFVCPFSMDRLAELLNLRFFQAHPELILCGEVVGPENPYNTEPVAHVKEDVQMFVFDVLDRRGRPLPPPERYHMLQGLGIQGVRHWGPFGAEDIEEVRRLVLELDSQGREGMVLKDASGTALKYVTPGSCLRDILATAGMLAELPAGFYVQRLWRAFFFSHEFGQVLPQEYLLQLIKGLYEENLRVLREVQEGGSLREDFTIRVNRAETVEALIRHLRHTGVGVLLKSLEPQGDKWVARFQRVFQKGTRELRRRLRGHGFYD
jgi:putative ATP-dependent DNA ligase